MRWALLCCAAAHADELTVGPGGFASLSEAIAQAQPGDTVRLCAGVYTEDTQTYPVVIDKPLTLVGEEGAVLESPPFTPLLHVAAPDVTVESIDFRLLRYGIVGLADWLTVKDCTFTLYDDTYRVSSCGIWLAGAETPSLRATASPAAAYAWPARPSARAARESPCSPGCLKWGRIRRFSPPIPWRTTW